MKRCRPAMFRTMLVLLLAVPATPAAAGSLISSTDWKARVDRTQPSKPRLVISARLVLPTPGYKIRLRLAALLKSFPPVPVYDLVLTPPKGPVAQVITRVNFRQVEPIAGPAYRRVIIRYQGKTIARIAVDDAKK